jgi:hypothetical protein
LDGRRGLALGRFVYRELRLFSAHQGALHQPDRAEGASSNPLLPVPAAEDDPGMKIDLEKFAHTLPYASENFGIYQPMLGWRAKRVVERIKNGLHSSFNPSVLAIASSLTPAVALRGAAGSRKSSSPPRCRRGRRT